MIVLDASLVVELVTKGPSADSVARTLFESGETVIVPHLLDIEVASALRGLAAGQRIDQGWANQALIDLETLPAERFGHAPLLNRIWELRNNFTAYDATYIALAEATGSVLYTSDSKLCKGHRARVKLITTGAN